MLVFQIYLTEAEIGQQAKSGTRNQAGTEQAAEASKTSQAFIQAAGNRQNEAAGTKWPPSEEQRPKPGSKHPGSYHQASHKQQELADTKRAAKQKQDEGSKNQGPGRWHQPTQTGSKQQAYSPPAAPASRAGQDATCKQQQAGRETGKIQQLACR